MSRAGSTGGERNSAAGAPMGEGALPQDVNDNNPWPGLASFTESISRYFFGRDAERDELFRLIRRQTLTVLFGKSGLGNTSLLQAGLLPQLRKAEFFPVYIRLDHNTNAPLTAQVKSALAARIVEDRIDAPEFQAEQTLWACLHQKGSNFWSDTNRLLIPALVFDQFEEIFTLGQLSGAARARGKVFLEELADLVENRVPESLKQSFRDGLKKPENYQWDQPACKVVLSLREDYLPELEGLRQQLHDVMFNRMRIQQMHGGQALEVVRGAGGQLVEEAVAQSIVKFVAKARNTGGSDAAAAGKRGESQAGASGHPTPQLTELEVEPALLSLVCRELNNKRIDLKLSTITPEQVAGSRKEILADFYDRTVADLPPEVRRFVEEKLLTRTGFRDNMALDNATSEPGISEDLIDLLVLRRLVRVEDRLGVKRVELTHDLLVEPVRDSREARRQRTKDEPTKPVRPGAAFDDENKGEPNGGDQGKPLVAPAARIISALRQIQEKFGFLDSQAMRLFSRESKIPLYRLEEVASFYPRFRRLLPPAMTVNVCRDFGCHMAGAAGILDELGALDSERLEVRSVSCLGRCDQAPAVGVEVHRRAVDDGDTAQPRSGGDGHHPRWEQFYSGLPASDLTRHLTTIVQNCIAGDVLLPEPAIQGNPSAADWLIDPYSRPSAHYGALCKAIEARQESINRRGEELASQMGWQVERVELFRFGATNGRLDLFTRGMLEAYRTWQMEDNWADAVFREMDIADLRGMGGAGIPASQKWRDVRDAIRAARRRGGDERGFIIANGNDSEPGGFKDRELLRHVPHLIVESVILAGLLTDASEGFIYIRREFPEQIVACRKEIERAEVLGFCGPKARRLGKAFPVSVCVSPGGYICGEQSALIESMSDRRGEPRNLPPKLETNGLDNQPTLVSNVETMAWTPYIWLKGGQAYAALGVNGWKGRRLLSVSGDVNRPGVYETPIGLTLRELICGEEYCRGIVGGQRLKALAPAGASGGFLPAVLTPSAGLPRNHAENRTWKELAGRRGFDPGSKALDMMDMELDLGLFRALSPTQALGSALIVYAEGRDMVEQAVNALEFFREESCGKCTPCRIGSDMLAALVKNLLAGRLDAPLWTTKLLPVATEMGQTMELTSICGLGRSVPSALRTLIEFFPADVAAHFKQDSDPSSAPATSEESP